MTGLLSFTEADNYGALLQAYALQKTLDNLDCDNVFLNFDLGVTAAPPRDLSKLPPLLRKKIEETVHYHDVRAGLFSKFRQKYLRLSERLSMKEAEGLNAEYDRFIVGSDQVWNYGVTSGNLLYALPFAEPSKRFSYAASFGGRDGITQASDRFWKELSSFSAISLREEVGADICKEKTGITPEVNIDPSMLLTKEEWEQLISNSTGDSDGEHYVFLFLIEYDAAFASKAKAFADEHGLPLRVVTASYIPQFGFDCFAQTGVNAWLKLIHDADYVFCDSFHATVFSILFEKNFMPNMSKAALAERSSRLSGLLDKLGLKADDMNESPDYVRIKQIIEAEREKSFVYIKKIIS